MFEQVEVNSERWFDKNCLADEEWKYIKELDNLYSISNYGRIYSLKTNMILKLCSNYEGYYDNAIKLKGKVIHIKVGKYVAKYFLENPNNFPVVNHIDGNKKNDRVDNLEWTTQKDNSQKAIEIGLRNKNREKYDQDYVLRKKYRNNLIKKNKNNLKHFVQMIINNDIIVILSKEEMKKIFSEEVYKRYESSKFRFKLGKISFIKIIITEEDFEKYKDKMLGSVEEEINIIFKYKDVM